MDGIWQLLGTITVAVIGLVGIILQLKSKEKSDNIDTKIDKIKNDFTKITDNFAVNLEQFKQESVDNDAKIARKIDDVRMNVSKRFLVTELTKISEGNYTPNEEQKRVLKDTKDEYNDAGGDSYVDDMYDDLRDRNLI